MAKPPLRACALPGPVWTKQGAKFVRSSISKKHCGTVVRVTSLGPGDFRLMSDVVVLDVARKQLYVPIKNIRLGRLGRD